MCIHVSSVKVSMTILYHTFQISMDSVNYDITVTIVFDGTLAKYTSTNEAGSTIVAFLSYLMSRVI